MPIRRRSSSASRPSVDEATGRTVSALRWGAEPPQLVLVHGGAQNAHTWDTVALALGRPLLAVDLPGHGHSGWRADGAYTPMNLADDVAVVIAAHAPGRGRDRRDVARRHDLDGARGPASRPRAFADHGRRDAGRERREGEGGDRLRRRAAELRFVRRPAGAHDAVQPDPLRVVTAPRHPPQRRAGGRRFVAVALRPGQPGPRRGRPPMRADASRMPRSRATARSGAA